MILFYGTGGVPGGGEIPMELLATAACVVPFTSGVSRTNRMYDLSV